jgi:RecA-family ATPase
MPRPAPPSRDGSNLARGTHGLKLLCPSEWINTTAPERRWIVHGVLPVGAVTMLNGDGGLGKSLLSLQLACSAATGKPWLGMETTPVKTLGVFCEDDPDELQRRMADVAHHYGATSDDLDRINLVSRVGEDNTLVEFTGKFGGGAAKPTGLLHQIKRFAVEFGARLVILDSLHDLFAGNENSRPEARGFVNLLRQIALAIDGAVLLNAHPSVAGLNSGTGSSGSTAWNNAVRSRLYLKRPDGDDADPDVRILDTKKSNYGPLGSAIEIKWKDGVFVRETPVTGDPYGAAQAAFLTCLDAVNGQGRYASASINSGTAYAPKLFSRMPQARGLSQQKLRHAMEALFNQGRIRIGEHRKGNRHTVEAIVRAE